MNNFGSIFNIDFFFGLGLVILAIAGLGLAISYRRSQKGQISLGFLLTTALATAYYTFQWGLSSFGSFYISNYMALHPEAQMPGWVSLALTSLFTALNYAFIGTLMLTVWFVIKKTKEAKLDLSQTPEEPETTMTEEEELK
jgi:hypothetical protein